MADFKRLYYDWEELREIDPKVQSARSAFNVGQWFGTAGVSEARGVRSVGRMGHAASLCFIQTYSWAAIRV